MPQHVAQHLLKHHAAGRDVTQKAFTMTAQLYWPSVLKSK